MRDKYYSIVECSKMTTHCVLCIYQCVYVKQWKRDCVTSLCKFILKSAWFMFFQLLLFCHLPFSTFRLMHTFNTSAQHKIFMLADNYT